MASQQNQIHQLMEEFKHIMASSFEDIKGSKLKYQHDVDMGDHKPIKSWPYWAPVHYREWIKEYIWKQKEAGIIVDWKSEWGAPAVLVPKKSGNGEFKP